MATSNRFILQNQLVEWMTKEMGMQPMGRYVNSVAIPNVDDFKPICQGTLVDVWKFITQHVKSTRPLSESVSEGNTKERIRIEKLKEKKKHLLVELEKAREKNQSLEKAVERVQDRVLTAERNVSEVKSKLIELQQSFILLGDYQKKCLEQISELQHANGLLESELTLVKEEHNKGSSLQNSCTISGPQSDKTSPLLNNIQETCDMIAGLIMENIVSQRLEGDKIHSMKKQQWEEICRTLKSNNASMVVTAMKYSTDQAILNFRRLAKETINFHNVHMGPSRTQTCYDQHLQDLKALYIRLWLQMLQNKHDVEKQKKTLDKTIDVLDGRLDVLFPDLEFKLFIRSLILKQAELASQIECQKSLQTTLKDMELEKEELMSKVLVVQEKKEAIAKLDHDIRKNQDLIKSLLYQNMQSATEIQTKHEELKNFVKESTLLNASEIESMKAMQCNWIDEEIALFKNLKLTKLYSVVIGKNESSRKMNINDLLINKNLPFEIESFHSVIRDLEFRPYMSPEELLWSAFKLSLAIQESKKVLQQYESFAKHAESKKAQLSTEYVNNAIKSITVAREELLSEHPGLQNSKQALNDVSSFIYNDLQKALTNWLKQPAQFIVLDTKVKGKLFVEWLQKWSSMVEKLHGHR